MGTPRRIYTALILLALLSVNCGLAQPIIDRVQNSSAIARFTGGDETDTTRVRPTPRPTFTPTPSYTDTPTPTPTFTLTPIPTDTATPTETPTLAATETPAPTETPVPTNTQPPPPPAPPTEVPTPEPTPTPSYAFKIKEQGNREFQKTNATFVSNIILISDANGTPLGGHRIVGSSSDGRTYESAESSWQLDATSGLEGYIKFGNLKFEPPGGYDDVTWTIYVVDSSGNQVSAPISLTYPSDPNQRAWDFIWWAQ